MQFGLVRAGSLLVILRSSVLFSDGSVDQLPYHVQVSDVARVFLQQMGEDPAKCRWIAGEPAA